MHMRDDRILADLRQCRFLPNELLRSNSGAEETCVGVVTAEPHVTSHGPQVSSDVVNEEPVKVSHTNLVRESFLQDPYDRQRPDVTVCRSAVRVR